MSILGIIFTILGILILLFLLVAFIVFLLILKTIRDIREIAQVFEKNNSPDPERNRGEPRSILNKQRLSEIMEHPVVRERVIELIGSRFGLFGPIVSLVIGKLFWKKKR